MSSLISQTRCLLFLLRVDNPAMFLAMHMCTVKNIDLFLIRLHVLRCPYSIFCSSTLYNDFGLGLLKVTESWVAVSYVFLRNPLNKFGATSEYWPSKDSIDVPKGILPKLSFYWDQRLFIHSYIFYFFWDKIKRFVYGILIYQYIK